MSGSSPAKFQAVLEQTKALLPTDPAKRVIFINAWNEWTEGARLEPDVEVGFGYLDALKNAVN